MGVPVNETLKIVNEYSQLVLEVEGEATTEGTRIEQYTDTGKDHQRWRVKSVGSDNEGPLYNIENVHSGMSLEVVGYSRENGTEVVQRRYDSSPHRQWTLVPVTGKEDVYKIKNRNSGLVLDDVGGQKDPPAPVRQYGSWTDDGRQQWKLIRVAKTTVRGLLYSWGLNNEGQLGDGTVTQQLAPEKSPYLAKVGIKSISAGASHSLALLEDGTVQAWGSQDYYQLGNPTWVDSREPVKVLDLEGVKAISAGGWHNLALRCFKWVT